MFPDLEFALLASARIERNADCNPLLPVQLSQTIRVQKRSPPTLHSVEYEADDVRKAVLGLSGQLGSDQRNQAPRSGLGLLPRPGHSLTCCCLDLILHLGLGTLRRTQQ